MNIEIWNRWLNNFKWIESVSKARRWNEFKWQPVKSMESKGWDIYNLQIEEPAPFQLINQIEKNTNQNFPEDFKTVLCEYSSAVRINWHMNEDHIEEFDGIFCGAGYGYIWDISLLEELYESYQLWLNLCNPNDEYYATYYNKIPFISVPNGDLIAFEKEIINGESAVIYLGKQAGELDGKRLAKSFTEFISKWSNIGLVGTEEWQLSPFYDYENEELSSDNDQVRLWKSILNK